MEIIVASAMKGYLRRMSEEEALKKVESIIEPKIIQLFGESGAPMPVQSHVDGAKFAAFIDEAVADSIRELEVREDDMSGVSIVVLQNVEGKSMVETMSPEFVGFIGDAYRSLKYERGKRCLFERLLNIVDILSEFEYNIEESKDSVWRHVKAVLWLGRLITGTL